jgi:UDP-glucose:(heptosyl)LPS alpha-1,3-glucosyltransferase
MKVALVIERMDVLRGGRETSTAQIAAGLASAGCEVAVLCQSGSLDTPGVKIETIPPRGLLRAHRQANFIADVQARISAGGFDIVHATLPVPGANVYQPRGGTIPAQAAASLRRRPASARWLFRLAEPFNAHRRRMGLLESQVARDSRVLCLSVSEMVAREFRQYYGRTEGVQTVFNAVDAPDPTGESRIQWRKKLREEYRLADADPVFVTIATNFELKGVAEAIDAFGRFYKRWKGPGNPAMLVVGRDYVEDYTRYASGRGVGRRVAFLPRMADVFPCFAAADACVLLSWYDPCSRVVLEATRWEIPSITTTYNGAAEILSGGAGIVVESPRDIEAVAAAMEELADPDNRRRRAEACRKISPHLAIERHIRELLEAYQTCMKERA